MSMEGFFLCCAIFCTACPVYTYAAYCKAEQYISPSGCIRQIRLQTETGTATYAFSDSPHVLELTVSGNPTGTPIPCDVNNYCDAGAIVDFTFDGSETASQCIHREDISGVRIRQGGNEGWFIKSVYTTYITDCGRELPLTADTAFYKWVDGDSDASYLVQELTLV